MPCYILSRSPTRTYQQMLFSIYPPYKPGTCSSSVIRYNFLLFAPPLPPFRPPPLPLPLPFLSQNFFLILLTTHLIFFSSSSPYYFHSFYGCCSIPLSPLALSLVIFSDEQTLHSNFFVLVLLFIFFFLFVSFNSLACTIVAPFPHSPLQFPVHLFYKLNQRV